MIPIRSGMVWLLVAGTASGPSVRAEDPPRAASPDSPPAERPAASPPSVAGEKPRALPVRQPDAVPGQVPMAGAVPLPAAAPAVRLAAPLQFRAINIVVGQPGVIVPRRVLIDANGVQKIVPAEFEIWAFGASGTNGAETRRRNLSTLLQQRLDLIDAVCILTADQRNRLEFYGRGDISRLFSALAQVKEEVDAAKDNFERIEEIYRANDSLRRSIVSGPFGEDSLLFKSMEPLLAPAQLTKFEPLRDVLRQPGQPIRVADGFVDVQISGMPFDDDGLSRVSQLWTGERGKLFRLRTLYLTRTQVTDAGLARLPASDTLARLSLSGTTISDAGLVDLRRFPDLRQLNVTGLAVGDETLREIGRLKRLETLSLSATQVTDAGLEHLRDLKDLTSLTLYRTAVGDEGIGHLAGLTNLHTLTIQQTEVTDAGIGKLRALTRLRVLYVQGSKVTNKGITELKRSLPNLRTETE